MRKGVEQDPFLVLLLFKIILRQQRKIVSYNIGSTNTKYFFTTCTILSPILDEIHE
jgi:hypothetical protein